MNKKPHHSNSQSMANTMNEVSCALTDKRNQPKPDDRSDNVDKLQQMVQNTLENIDEAEETMSESSVEANEEIKAKNQRRAEAVEAMRHEIKDESEDQLHQ